ncbi:MAG: ABC transporter permease [Acidobacteriota bacterium]
MSIWMIMKVSAKALTRNKFRAFLTMLGIIIGVAAVIAMISLGRGAQEQVKERISSMGTDIIWVRAGSRNEGGMMGGSGTINTLTVDDFEAMQRECPSVVTASPTANTAKQVVYGGQNWNTRIEGYNEQFPVLRNWKIAAGTSFGAQQVRSAARVAVIGQTVADQLFPGVNPVGKTIRVGALPFKVLGVLGKKGADPRGFDQDDTIIVPYSTVQKKFQGGVLYVQSGIVKAVDGQAGYAEAQTQGVMTTLLASIASVSLLVGGIGIMNIMLVSVSERTREIGIHMSIGARPNQVRVQFLFESIVLCLLGGLIGLGLGVGGSYALTTFLSWSTSLSPDAVAAAIIFPVAIGVFFGYYPAHKAAALDPIEALRYE